jgi:hypothetical protein
MTNGLLPFVWRVGGKLNQPNFTPQRTSDRCGQSADLLRQLIQRELIPGRFFFRFIIGKRVVKGSDGQVSIRSFLLASCRLQNLLKHR